MLEPARWLMGNDTPYKRKLSEQSFISIEVCLVYLRAVDEERKKEEIKTTTPSLQIKKVQTLTLKFE